MRVIIYNSLAATLGMICLQLNFLIDYFWLSRINSDYLSGVAVFVTFFAVVECWTLVINGGSINLLPRFYGEKNRKKLVQTISTSLIFNVPLACVLFAVAFVFFRTIIMSFSSSSEVTEYAITYGGIGVYNFLLVPFVVFFVSLYRTTKNPFWSMSVLLVVSITNMILDPVLIFWFEWGLEGAAWATVFAHVIGVIYGIVLLKIKQTNMDFSYVDFRGISKKMLGKIIKLGAPVSVFYFVFNLSVFVLISIVGKYGVEVTSIFGFQLRIVTMLAVVSGGHALAVSSMAGNMIGEKKDIRAFLNKSGVMLIVFYGVLATAFYICSDTFSMILFGRAGYMSLATDLNRIVAVFLFFIAMVFYFQIVLMYMGFPVRIFILNLIISFGIEVPFLIWMNSYKGYDVRTFYWGMLLLKMLVFTVYAGNYFHLVQKKFKRP
ncbi:MAG: hypothetical protein KAQ98_08380 [Bacteriovoracaceae bacterium]|nr:hypothetical protein [Bacteriovoracaceae bacterium]